MRSGCDGGRLKGKASCREPLYSPDMPVVHGFSVPSIVFAFIPVVGRGKEFLSLDIFNYLLFEFYQVWVPSLQPKQIWSEHWFTCQYSFSKWQGCMAHNLKWMFVISRCGNYMVMQTCDFNDINCQVLIGECKAVKRSQFRCRLTCVLTWSLNK